MSRTNRLLSLLQLLRARSFPVTAAVLAAELGVSERTLYRDVASLVAQGAPIQGEAGLGYVLRPGLFLPPLMLTEDETEAVVLGLGYVEQRGDASLGAAARAALVKIAAVLSPRALEALRNPTVLASPVCGDFPKNVVELGVLREAIRAQAKLRLDYVDVNGARTDRVVWPIALGFLNATRVLVAWCELRKDYRTFRTDRIGAAHNTDERYSGRRSVLLRTWRVQMGLEADDVFAPDRN
ncbi:MAG: YafY family protein [Caulobacteraceae bacterium]